MIKNRYKLYLIIVSIILACISIIVFAKNNIVSANDNNWYEDFTYTLKNDNTVLLTSFNNDNATSVEISNTIEIDEIVYDVIIGNSLFKDKINLTSITIDEGVKTNYSCENMFYGCEKLTNLNMTGVNTEDTTKMQYMFYKCQNLKELDLSGFNTSKVNRMDHMFEKCSSLTSLDLSNFDTSEVTTLYYTFAECRKLQNLIISSFNTENVVDMKSTFSMCENLESIDLSSFNTSKVTEMNSMFYNCSKLTELDLSNFDTHNCKSMSSMFYGCKGLATLDLSNFNTSEVTDMFWMLKDCSGLTSINVSSFDTSKTESIEGMFQGCSSLTSIDISNFDTNALKTTEWHNPNYNDGSTHSIAYEELFCNCDNLTEITLGEKFQFVDCNSATGEVFNLDFNTSNQIWLKKGLWKNTKGIAYNYEKIPSNTKETYTFQEETVYIRNNKYNEFNWQANDIDAVGYQITESITSPSSEWITDGELRYGTYYTDVNTPKEYYVWVKDINDRIHYGTISTYKITVNEGEGTSLKIKANRNSANDINNKCVLYETVVFVDTKLEMGYNTLIVINQSDDMIRNHSTRYIDCPTTFTSFATKNENLIVNDQILTINYSDEDQIIYFENPENGLGEYKYWEMYQKDQRGIRRVYFSIQGTKITVKGKTPAGFHFIKMRITDKNTNNQVETIITIIINEPEPTSVSITSEVYEEEDGKMITGIQPLTIKSRFEEKIDINCNYFIRDFYGEVVSDSTIIENGYTLVLEDGSERSLIVKGDADNDGDSDLLDILLMNKHRLGKTSLKDIQFRAADIDNNSEIEIEDILLINKYRLRKTNEL